MCLESISNLPFEVEIENSYMVGWKSVHDIHGELFPNVMRKGTSPLKEAEWLKEEDFRRDTRPCLLTRDGSINYPKGFHFFPSFEEALEYRMGAEVIRKIYFRNPVAYGYQDEIRTIVAKEIFIPRVTS